jgi:hypothetical protein
MIQYGKCFPYQEPELFGSIPVASLLLYLLRDYWRLLYFELSNPEIMFVAEAGSIECCGVPCIFRADIWQFKY